jgi:hypothetical protein
MLCTRLQRAAKKAQNIAKAAKRRRLGIKQVSLEGSVITIEGHNQLDYSFRNFKVVFRILYSNKPSDLFPLYD